MEMILPKEHEIQSFAYELFERRGSEHGWDLADWLLAERAVTFHKNYERVALYLLDNDSKLWVEPKSPTQCRFCGKQPPDATFHDTTHAIPELLGNRSVFSTDECDACNHFFGEGVEDEFGRFLAGARSLIVIPGKTGVPSYKTNDKLSRIDYKDNKIEVRPAAGSGLVDVDIEARTANFSLQSQSHIPLAIYKCLTKIALSVLPPDELSHFGSTMRWILNPDHTQHADAFSQAFAHMWFSPGPFPLRYGWVELFRRRHPSLPIPYLAMVLVVKNLTFQVYVPICDLDSHLFGKDGKFPAFPAGSHIVGYGYGETQYSRMPLNSATPTTIPFKASVTMVGEIVTTPPPQK